MNFPSHQPLEVRPGFIIRPDVLGMGGEQTKEPVKMNYKTGTDNPAAFPSDLGGAFASGMTLWHYFAGQALAGYCSVKPCDPDSDTDLAIQAADIMMQAHHKRFGSDPLQS